MNETVLLRGFYTKDLLWICQTDLLILFPLRLLLSDYVSEVAKCLYGACMYPGAKRRMSTTGMSQLETMRVRKSKLCFLCIGTLLAHSYPISASHISEAMIGSKDSCAGNCVYQLLVSGSVFAHCVPKH